MEHRNKLRRLWCSGESPFYVYRQPNCHCQVTLPFCSMKSVWFKEESFELQSLLLLCLLGTKQRKTKISPCLCSILHLHKRKWRQHWKIYINRPENYFALFLSMKIFSFLFLSQKIKPTWLSYLSSTAVQTIPCWCPFLLGISRTRSPRAKGESEQEMLSKMTAR